MGALHEGHTSLVRLGHEVADRVVLSIFVNPLQFGPNEDFERYPRDLARDLEIAEAAGVGLVFAPEVGELYPQGEPWVNVVPVRGADRLCGRNRPGHFAGVLTVVAKLLGITQPDVAIFGQKDYQQLLLIRRLVADLEYPVEIQAGPIIREEDGLALSSRNRYLSPAERERARAIPRALAACEELFEASVQEADVYLERLRQVAEAGLELEYAEAVDPETLERVEQVERGTLCLLAAKVGQTRLIDNHRIGSDFHSEIASAIDSPGPRSL